MRNTLWSISSDHPLLSSIRHGITFQLIQETFQSQTKPNPEIVIRRVLRRHRFAVGSFDRFDFEMYVKTNYTLIVTVRKHPTIILREEYQDPKSFRYVVDLNQAESPV